MYICPCPCPCAHAHALSASTRPRALQVPKVKFISHLFAYVGLLASYVVTLMWYELDVIGPSPGSLATHIEAPSLSWPEVTWLVYALAFEIDKHYQAIRRDEIGVTNDKSFLTNLSGEQDRHHPAERQRCRGDGGSLMQGVQWKCATVGLHRGPVELGVADR